MGIRKEISRSLLRTQKKSLDKLLDKTQFLGNERSRMHSFQSPRASRTKRYQDPPTWTPQVGKIIAQNP